MKTFKELAKDEKQAAIDRALNELLQAISEGAIRFDDERNSDSLQRDIDNAIATAERLQTPWFAHEYVMAAVGETLRGMATSTAEDVLYADPDERVVHGIVKAA